MDHDPDFSKPLDFSRFHDLEHRPFSAYCRGMYGGPRRHLHLWWTYKLLPDLHRETLCRLGRHRWINAWSEWNGEHRACRHCFTPQGS